MDPGGDHRHGAHGAARLVRVSARLIGAPAVIPTLGAAAFAMQEAHGLAAIIARS